jgi:hypothetical protein
MSSVTFVLKVLLVTCTTKLGLMHLTSCNNIIVTIIICMHACMQLTKETTAMISIMPRTQTLEIGMNGGLLLDTVAWQLQITFLKFAL